MKKLILVALLSLFCTGAYCQKKKVVKKKTSTSASKDGPSAEMIKNNFYLMINNKGKKDTLLLKKMANGKLPAESKVSVFTTKGGGIL